MTQEDKDLILKDLCTRLPYGVKAYIKNWSKLENRWIEGIYTVVSVDPSLNDIYASIEKVSVEVILGHSDYSIEPYLFPLSSMTEEQYDEMEKIVSEDYLENIQVTKEIKEKVDFITHWPLYSPKVIDWFNKNHFDYHGLIEKGLAINATGLNIY